MKRCSLIVMLAVLLGAFFGPVNVANAMEVSADTGLQTDDWYEVTTVLSSERFHPDVAGEVVMERTEVYSPDQQRDATHTERILSARHEFRVNGELVVWVNEVCTVWDYPDGKVHLYSRSLSLSVVSGYEGSYLTYGSIFNTDGSYSGTTGDRVCVTDGTHTAHFGLYFYVTTETYKFSSGRVSP